MTASGSPAPDSLEARRREVEAARTELAQSLDQLGQHAIERREQTIDRVREYAVPVAIAAGAFLVARTLRRRRKRRPILEIGPFSLSERR
jgi:hypothetical protein